MRDRDRARKLALVDFNTPVADIVRLGLTIRNPGLDLNRLADQRPRAGCRIPCEVARGGWRSEPGLELEEVTKSEI